MSMKEIEITGYTEPSKTGFVGVIKRGLQGYVVWKHFACTFSTWLVSLDSAPSRRRSLRIVDGSDSNRLVSNPNCPSTER